MVFEIDERVSPKEIMFGIKGNMCYMTYMETKGKVTDINSKKSWTDWSENSSNPEIYPNEFKSGYRLQGVNGRCSSNAANAENLVIEHPDCKKGFEISLKRFIEIASDCSIINGEFKQEFIITKTRDMVTRKEYDELVEQANIRDNKESEKASTLKGNKISTKD